jgi:putative oxidoreductase
MDVNGTATRPLEDAAALLGRVLLSVLFLTSGWAKLFAAAGTTAYFAKVGVPMPTVAYYVALLVELLLGAMFLVGWFTRWTALVLAAWCVGSAVFGHAEIGDRNQWIHFLKNLGLAGGFLHAFAFGGGAFSLDAFVNRRGTGVGRSGYR